MSERKSRGIVIKNLDESATILDLWNAFNKFGKITSISMMLQKFGNKVNAIVEFDNPDSADKVVDFGEMKVLDEARPVFYARPSQIGRRPLIASRKLHVTGVPASMAIEELQDLLGNCQISLPKNNRSFMFATFVDEKSKNEALFKLNGRKMDEKHVLKLSPAINTSYISREKFSTKK